MVWQVLHYRGGTRYSKCVILYKGKGREGGCSLKVLTVYDSWAACPPTLGTTQSRIVNLFSLEGILDLPMMLAVVMALMMIMMAYNQQCDCLRILR